jgi:hypothetical protein
MTAQPRMISFATYVRPGAVLLPLLLLLVTACGGRRTPVPDIGGALADVVVRSAFADVDTPGMSALQPLLLDSISFHRLGTVVGDAAFSVAELERHVARPFRLVDRNDVLECPDREPCRTVDNAVYVEIWEAEQTRSGLEMVVSRVFNIQGLHVMTRSVTHRLTLSREAGGWRLTGIERLPS